MSDAIIRDCPKCHEKGSIEACLRVDLDDVEIDGATNQVTNFTIASSADNAENGFVCFDSNVSVSCRHCGHELDEAEIPVALSDRWTYNHAPVAPVVLCIRDPDCGNDYVVDGDVRIITLDMGASFDGPKHFNVEENGEWAWSALEEAKDLRDDSLVRQTIVSTIHGMLGREGLAILLAERLNDDEAVLPTAALAELCIDRKGVYSEDDSVFDLDEADNGVIDFGWLDNELVLLKRRGGRGAKANWEVQVTRTAHAVRSCVKRER